MRAHQRMRAVQLRGQVFPSSAGWCLRRSRPPGSNRGAVVLSGRATSFYLPDDVRRRVEPFLVIPPVTASAASAAARGGAPPAGAAGGRLDGAGAG